MIINKVALQKKIVRILMIFGLPIFILVNLMPLFTYKNTIQALIASFSIQFSAYLVTSILIVFILRYEEGQYTGIFYKILAYIGSFVFSFYLVLGQVYSQQSQFYSMRHGTIYFFLFLAKILAITLLVEHLISLGYKYLDSLLISNDSKQVVNTNFNFWRSWFTLLICWLPYVLIVYPASSNPDTSNQIVEFFGKGAWVRDVYPIGHYLLGQHPFSISNQHNFFVTIFYGICVKTGLTVFHSINVGLFIAAIIQLLTLSLILIYSLKIFRVIDIDPRTIKFVENIYRFFPLFPIFSLFLVKNVLYASFVLWFLCLILQFSKYPSKLEDHQWQSLIVLSIIGQLITQKYAFIVLLLTSFIFLICYRKQYKQILLIFLMPLLIFRIGIEGFLFGMLQVPQGDPIEGQGIMIQQTALCVKDHADTISRNEYKVLNKVFVVKNMNEVYTPEQSDGIKSSGAMNKKTVYRWKTVTSKELKDYHRVWMQMAFKYPGTYVEAALHLGYRYLDINSPARDSSWSIAADSLPVVTNEMYLNLGKQIHQNDFFLFLRKTLVRVFNVLNKIPPFSFLFQGSFYIWLTVFILLYGIYVSIKNYKNILLIGSNLLLQVPVYLMSPIDNNSRYFLPFIFSIGILIVLPKFLKRSSSKL